MKDINSEFGQNAGRVWQAISTHGPLSKTQLLRATRLNEKKLCAAIGWLARENKIWENNNTYGLGDTNLTEKIGSTAGKIWKALETWGEVDISSISRLADVETQDAYSALGWLAREDKIQTKQSSAKDRKVKFILK